MINIVEQLRNAARDTCNRNKPAVRPDQMLFWKAANEIERLQAIISISETPKDWVDVLIDDVQELTGMDIDTLNEMSIKDLLEEGARACFMQQIDNDISDRIRYRLAKVNEDFYDYPAL
jgi:hypothetical protein